MSEHQLRQNQLQVQISFADILNWHNYLCNVKEPSLIIKECIAKLEVHIAHNINGFQMNKIKE